MTILDAELFQKIEIPEVLVWAREQNEERSPNLALFTAHFNNLSYWWEKGKTQKNNFRPHHQKNSFRARTQILKQNDAKDREKYVMKFIKIMKHLRKINNYNSYLALLSALGDSLTLNSHFNNFNKKKIFLRFRTDPPIGMAKEYNRRTERILCSYWFKFKLSSISTSVEWNPRIVYPLHRFGAAGFDLCSHWKSWLFIWWFHQFLEEMATV